MSPPPEQVLFVVSSKLQSPITLVSVSCISVEGRYFNATKSPVEKSLLVSCTILGSILTGYTLEESSNHEESTITLIVYFPELF